MWSTNKIKKNRDKVDMGRVGASGPGFGLGVGLVSNEVVFGAFF